MNMTIIVVTRLKENTVYSTFINLEGEDDPYIMGVRQYGPPFLVTGQPEIPSKIGETKVTVKRHESS